MSYPKNMDVVSTENMQLEKVELTPEQKIHALEAELAAEKAKSESLEAELRRMDELSGKDKVTGVEPRWRFDEELLKEVSGAIRKDDEVSVIFIDVDRFKGINDRYGHKNGDVALKAVAQTLSMGVRLTDSVFRHGGDEFAVILPATSKPEATIVAIRLLHSATGLKVETDNNVIPIDISLGIDTFRPSKRGLLKVTEPHLLLPFAEELTTGADKAMYAAKHAHKVGIIIDDDREKFAVGEILRHHKLNRSDVQLVPRSTPPPTGRY